MFHYFTKILLEPAPGGECILGLFLKQKNEEKVQKQLFFFDQAKTLLPKHIFLILIFF